MTPPRQRELLYYDGRRRQVRGVFYVGGRRRLWALMSFAEADIAGVVAEGPEKGRAIYRDARAQKRSAARQMAAWQAKRRELETAVAAVAGASAVPVRKAMQEWIDAARATRAKQTVALYLQAANEYVAAVGDHPMSAWGPAQFDRLMIALAVPRKRRRVLENGRETFEPYSLSAAARNIRLNALKAFQRWATERPALERPYVPKPYRIRLLPVEREAPRAPTNSEARTMLEECARLKTEGANRDVRRAWLCVERAIMALLAFGPRRGEVILLPMASLDLTAGVVVITAQGRHGVKERRFKRPALPAYFVAYAEAQQAEHPKDVYWLDDGKGNPQYRDAHSLTTALRRLRGRLGLRTDWKPAHGFRAKWITDLWREGVDVATLQQGVGHRNVSTTLGYLTAPQGKLADAAKIAGRNYAKIVTARIENRSRR